MVIIQARSQDLMEEKKLGKRSSCTLKLYLWQQCFMEEPGASYGICLMHLYAMKEEEQEHVPI